MTEEQRLKGNEACARYWKRWGSERSKEQAILKLCAMCLFGGRCVRCGFNDPRALQFDHINGGGARERRAKRPVKYKDLIYKPESRVGLQLLCANCNWIKKFENKEAGSYAGR